MRVAGVKAEGNGTKAPTTARGGRSMIAGGAYPTQSEAELAAGRRDGSVR